MPVSATDRTSTGLWKSPSSEAFSFRRRSSTSGGAAAAEEKSGHDAYLEGEKATRKSSAAFSAPGSAERSRPFLLLCLTRQEISHTEP